MSQRQCPADRNEIVDAYRAGRLSQQEALRFEEHYLGCPRCSEPFQFTASYVHAYVRAAERLGAVMDTNANLQSV